MASATKLQTGFQFLTKDFLRLWMVDIHQEGRSQRSATQKRHKAHWLGVPGNWVWDREGRSHAAPEKSELVKLLVAWAAPMGKAQNTGPTKPAPLWSTQEPELSGLGLESACNLGPAPCRATWSLSSVDGESTHSMSRGKPSVAGTLWVPLTHTSDICLQCPSLPTARLNKRT